MSPATKAGTLIEVGRLVGPNAVTRESGQRLAEAVRPHLHANSEVMLDMRGVNVLASPFLLSFMGRLLNELPVDRLNQQIRFLGLAFHHRELIRRVRGHIKAP